MSKQLTAELAKKKKKKLNIVVNGLSHGGFTVGFLRFLN